MIEHRLRVSVVPWQDARLVHQLDAVCAALAADHLGIDSLAAADIAQRALRADGFSRAVVEYHRTVDDVFHARAEWIVRRDGPAH